MATSLKSPTGTPPRAGKGRNAFVRTNVPRGERIAGGTIVALLVGIGAVIYLKGQRFDPNIYSLRTEALNFTSAKVEGKQGTLRETSSSGPEEGSTLEKAATSAKPSAESGAAEASGDEGHDASAAPAKATAPALSKEPLELAIPGLKPMGPTEFYSADNLFEKIDGRAPAYLAFNFQQLRNRTFSIDGLAGSFVDVYEFRMDTPVNAFGGFAMERDPKGSPLDFIPDGYAGELGYYFRQGAVYVQVIASDQNPKTIEMAKAVAMARAKAIPVDDAGLDGRRKLPAAGLVADSVSFVQDNAQGQEFLKSVFQAAYQFEGKKLPFFVMSTTDKAALAAWTSFQAFCGKFGGKMTPLPDVNGAKLFKAENFGTWKVVYCRQSSADGKGDVGGIYDSTDPEQAQKFIEQYLKGEIQ